MLYIYIYIYILLYSFMFCIYVYMYTHNYYGRGAAGRPIARRPGVRPGRRRRRPGASGRRASLCFSLWLEETVGLALCVRGGRKRFMKLSFRLSLSSVIGVMFKLLVEKDM